MSHHPMIAGIEYIEVSSPVVACNFDFANVDILTDYLHEDDIGQCHNEEHVDGFVAHLPVASNIVAYQVAGSPKELQ